MSTTELFLYLFLTAITANLVRILPIFFIRGRIRNSFVRSFLYYVPYVTLSVMTFPAITEATQQPWTGFAALILGIAAAWHGWDLFRVSLLCCLSVLFLEMFANYFAF